MRMRRYTLAASLVLGASFLLAAPMSAFAQGRDRPTKASTKSSASVSIVLTSDMRVLIKDYYADIRPRGVESLPPGIRKRLARGKPLPPGIAKRGVPAGLRERLRVPDGYELVEVGLDVLLVEVGTAIVRDVLRDIVR